MKNNDDRDNELDQLLKPLKRSLPNELQMQKWKSAVQTSALKKIYSTSRTKWAFQLMAALFLGIIIGAFAFKNNQSAVQRSHLLAQISFDDATYESSHSNLD